MAEQPESFGQFVDDVVYFKDNFGGIGFWPLPPVESAQTERLEAIMRAELLSPRLPAVLSAYEGQLTGICTWACPNRVTITALGALIFLANALLIWRANYRGWTHRMAYQTMGVGVVNMLNLAFFVLALMLVVCDPAALWPQIVLAVFVLGLIAQFIISMVLRAHVGPKP